MEGVLGVAVLGLESSSEVVLGVLGLSSTAVSLKVSVELLPPPSWRRASCTSVVARDASSAWTTSIARCSDSKTPFL